VAAATDQVALIRWHGYDLVRVGKPRRLELATWRYGERLRARRREQLKFVVPLSVAALGLAVAVNVAAGGSVGVFVWNTPRLVKRIYVEMVGRRKIVLVEPPICERCGNVMLLRARHLERARVTTTAREGMALLLTCPRCGAEGTMLTGGDAQFALRRGLTYLNLARGGRQRAEDAARLVEGAGGPHQLIHDVARRELTLRSLAPDRRLALEMAVDERAEVEELERQWKEAEEIAEIADGMLSSDPRIDEELRRLRELAEREKKRSG
jgi:ribosomal protein S27AE